MKVELTCPNCGTVKLMNPSVVQARKSCSRKCAIEMRSLGRKPKRECDKAEWQNKKKEYDEIRGYVKGVFAWDEPEVMFA